MAQVRNMRNGRDYDPEWGKRQRGEGPYAKLIADRFAAACRRLGLDKPRLALDHTQFRHPLGPGGQGDLFTQPDDAPPLRAVAEPRARFEDKA